MKTISKLTMVAALATIASQAVAMDKVKQAVTSAKHVVKTYIQKAPAPKTQQPKPMPWPLRPKGTIAGC